MWIRTSDMNEPHTRISHIDALCIAFRVFFSMYNRFGHTFYDAVKRKTINRVWKYYENSLPDFQVDPGPSFAYDSMTGRDQLENLGRNAQCSLLMPLSHIGIKQI